MGSANPKARFYSITTLALLIVIVTAVLISLGLARAQSGPAVPAMPADFRTHPLDRSATLIWTVSGDEAIERYQYRINEGSWTDIPNSGHRTWLFTVVGLRNGTEYLFSLRAVNSVGDGAVAQATVTPATVPAAPMELSADVGDENIMLFWEAGDDGGAPITGYELSIDGAQWDTVLNDDPTATNYTVMGITVGWSYNFRLRAVNQAGPGQIATATTANTLPGDLPAAPTNLIATAGDRQITYSWDPPNDESITYYEWRNRGYNPNHRLIPWQRVPNSDGSTTSFTIPHYNGHLWVKMQLRAVNPAGRGPAQSNGDGQAQANPKRPAAPALLDVFVVPDPPGVALTWGRISHAVGRGSTVTKLQYQLDDEIQYQFEDDRWTDVPDSGPSGQNRRSITLTLPNLADYAIAVRAVTNIGVSGRSELRRIGLYGETVELLNTVLTVGDFPSIRGKGYDAPANPGGSDGFGSLGEDRFTHDGVTYTIKGLYRFTDSRGLIRLLFGTDIVIPQDLKAGLRLELDDQVRRLGIRRNPLEYTWNRPNLGWSSGDQVTVKLTTSVGTPGIDYDSDGDGLQEISTWQQLRATRWGSGVIPPGAWGYQEYRAAFPNPIANMGCPDSDCHGFELANDLDFDTNGDGEVGPGDDYWNGGAGWEPVHVRGVFEGNGHVIRNLYINRPNGYNIALFSHTGSVVRNLGLVDVDVLGLGVVGGLTGTLNRRKITTSYVTGTVTGRGVYVGGLVGDLQRGRIIASYSGAAVTGSSFVGGLAGLTTGGTITASYAYGPVTATETSVKGGLVGVSNRGVDVIDSYWDTQTTGITSDSGAGTGKTTAELQSPTSYTGIYANWDVDLNGDGIGDAPWYVGASDDYPRLGAEASTQALIAPQAPEMLISVSNDNPSPGDSARMTATVENPPDGDPTYRWERRLSSGWQVTSETGKTATVKFDSEGARTYQVTAIYPNGEQVISEPITLRWMTTPPPPATISISYSNDNPSPGDSVTMTATVENPPEGDPTYRWERRLSSGWRVRSMTGNTATSMFDSEGTRTWQVTAIYPNGEEITSEIFSLTWN